MANIELRAMGDEDWGEVASLIYDSTNAWYVARGRPPIFAGPKDGPILFCAVYEQLDPGCCVVADDRDANRLAGSCFYHPRSTHVSLGIMNVHPDYFGQGIASQLLRFVTEVADRQRKPMRLVSSALNLDSYSLYNRVGFVPRAIYHDMIMKVPDGGLEQRVPGSDRVRQATQHDLAAMVELEWSVNHIRREKDLRYFVENPDGIWHVSVLEGKQGGLDGFPRLGGPSGQQHARARHHAFGRGCGGAHFGRVESKPGPPAGMAGAGPVSATGAHDVRVGGGQLRAAFRPVARRLDTTPGHRHADIHAGNRLSRFSWEGDWR
jgi:GNAT superfamily N-acetyltransferase